MLGTSGDSREVEFSLWPHGGVQRLLLGSLGTGMVGVTQTKSSAWGFVGTMLMCARVGSHHYVSSDSDPVMVCGQ